MALNVPGLIVVIIFYALIVIVGILAARFVTKKDGVTDTEMSMVAGRNLHVVVGIFTMTATSVGGGYLIGTTESVAAYGGICWTVFPFTIVAAFTLGSLIFAKPMRERHYLTVLDPLQERYGDVMTGLLLIGALFAELVWGASILIALGSSLGIIIDIGIGYSIVISAVVALLYTCFGAAISVAYTDVVQLILVAIGMILVVPFVWTNENVGNFEATRSVWLGTITNTNAATWVDYVLAQVAMCIACDIGKNWLFQTLGGIPWNTFMMRILAARTVRQAQIVSVVGGIFGFAMAIPPAMLGIAGISADWNSTEYGKNPVDANDAARLMPLVIQFFSPKAVSVIALAAIVAAVMSSMDSIILSSSSMFTHNIYRLAIRPKASEKELRVVQLIGMFIVAAICTIIALSVNTVAGIFVLTADIVYVILFPQFVCSVFLPFTNTYGAFMGLVVGFILRLGGGEPSLFLKPFIYYPFYDHETNTQLFPFKTFAMICAFLTVLLISFITREMFIRGVIPAKYDISKRVVPQYDIATQENQEFQESSLSESFKNEQRHKYQATNPSFISSASDIKTGMRDNDKEVIDYQGDIVSVSKL